MSVERHPNINAAGFVTDIIVAFQKYLRGKANQDKHTRSEAFDILNSELAGFVSRVDEKLDSRFGGLECTTSASPSAVSNHS